jgi:DNA-binding transcriptional ArsR family regulator
VDGDDTTMNVRIIRSSGRGRVGEKVTMAVRIHFTVPDLTRVRLVPQLSPIRETLSSVTLMRLPVSRQGAGADWVREARPLLRAGVRPLLELQPGMLAATLSFIARTELRHSLPEAVEAIRATPRSTIARDIETLCLVRRLPRWVHQLPDRDGDTLTGLTQAIKVYFDTVLAPGWDAIQEQADRDYAFRVRTLADQGAEGLFHTLAPVFQWRPPVLHWDTNHETLPPLTEALDIHLSGRGVIFMPTMFWSGLATEDGSRPPVVTYPIPGGALALAHRDDDAGRRAAIAGLLGRTRAAVLEASVIGRSTSELATHLDISPGSASEHAKALRLAGLVTSHRHGNTVRHYISPLGQSLLTG